MEKDEDTWSSSPHDSNEVRVGNHSDRGSLDRPWGDVEPTQGIRLGVLLAFAQRIDAPDTFVTLTALAGPPPGARTAVGFGESGWRPHHAGIPCPARFRRGP